MLGCNRGVRSCQGLTNKGNESEVVRGKANRPKNNNDTVTSLSEIEELQNGVVANQAVDEGRGYCNAGSAEFLVRKENSKTSTEDKGHEKNNLKRWSTRQGADGLGQKFSTGEDHETESGSCGLSGEKNDATSVRESVANLIWSIEDRTESSAT